MALAQGVDAALIRLRPLVQLFPDRLYLELTRCGREGEENWNTACPDAGRRTRSAGARQQRRSLPQTGRFRRPRGARVHQPGPGAGRPEAPAGIQRPAIPEDAGGDGGTVRRHPRGIGKHRRAGQALHAGARIRHLLPAGFSRTRGLRPQQPHPRALPPGSERATRQRTAGSRSHPGRLRSPARARTRCDHRDGLSRLLPDRCGLHQLGQAERHPGRAGPRFRRGLAGRLGTEDHRPRSAAVQPAVRALPQSRTRVDARLRHRLLHGSP